MSEHTAIGWTESTWNPVTGCSRVSPGCENCYAEGLSLRMGWSKKAWTAQNAKENVILHPDRINQPLSWTRPRRVFVNSMSDLFHELVPDTFLVECFAVMLQAHGRGLGHVFQILTKRPERMRDFMSRAFPNPLPNVWLGVSVEDQRRADERIPLLLETPAVVRFISAEPLLGPVDLYDYLHPSCECELSDPMSAAYQHDEACPAGAGRLDWVIVGGESGPENRPMDLRWITKIALDCAGAGISLYVKQDSGSRPGKQGRLSDELWARKEYPPVVPA